MASDHTLTMREAIVQKLQAAAVVTALVPSASIYGEQPPAAPSWPFIRYGMPTTTAYESSCGDGSEHDIMIDVFAHGPGMDTCAKACAAVAMALDNAALAVDPLGLLGIDYVSTQIIRDGAEMSAYHGMVRFSATTINEES